MTRYAITYDRPLTYDYGASGGAPGSVETNLSHLSGTIRRRSAGPRTTIGFKAQNQITNKMVRRAVRRGPDPTVGKALVAQLDTNVEVDVALFRHSRPARNREVAKTHLTVAG